jgi:hypothetical protein
MTPIGYPFFFSHLFSVANNPYWLPIFLFPPIFGSQ